MTFEERITEIDKVVAYFTNNRKGFGHNSLSEESCALLEITSESLKQLNTFHVKEFGMPLQKIAYLSTNIVEIFFSEVRSKVSSTSQK